MRKRCAVLAFVGALCGAAQAGIGAPERPATGPVRPSHRLDREIDLRLSDADVTAAMTALNATGLVAVRLVGQAPERKVTIAVRSTPIREVLDGLSALYGLRWEQRVTTVLLLPRVKGQPSGSGGGETSRQASTGVQTLPETNLPASPEIPVGSSGRGASPEPVGETGDAVADAVALLRERGFGRGRAPEWSEVTPGHVGTIRRLAGVFTPDELRRMAAAGPDASRYGVRVRDLAPGARDLVLGWQQAQHTATVKYHLWQAAQPFDPNKFLDATMYVSFMPDADGLARGRPSLTLKGPDWSVSYGLPN